MHYQNSLRLRCFLVIATPVLGLQGLANADLSFAWRVPTQAVAHPIVADLDGDGAGDLVLHAHIDPYHIHDPSREPGLYWFPSPLRREFGTLFRGPLTGDRVDAADINGDGRIDIASGRYAADGTELVCWYENPGPGGLAEGVIWKEHVLGTQAGHIKDILCRDIDGNGQVDVITRGHTESSVFFQTAEAWKKRVLAHERREGLALGDLDLDGDLDIVMNGFWFETPDDPLKGDFLLHVFDDLWFTQDTGSWQDNAVSAAVGDLNADGLPDIVMGHAENVGYPLVWYSVEAVEQVTTGPWQRHTIAATFDWCETIDLGDVDLDGDLDLLAAKFERHGPKDNPWANFAPFPVVLYLNDGTGRNWESRELADHGIYAGKFGDLEGDGDLDIVGPESYYRGPIHVWINQLRQPE